ncbi:peptide-methionine (S)-S-oxide reductase MsrA [Nonlabens ponticola]|uniref:Peptide methionine sulfoxide reductase MsrA n=1 Tax=Nonlabens ponticola TaxID=2496866 RepID=A0A3S9N0X8_9FLAO|nr:peptide-methionine (S)-S-oxide reductase MsrA [Nonlabens ponticola]AZQ45048.1 peptide-methionine (S)-S-oxide reductase [Nonlabens ponticola]
MKFLTIIAFLAIANSCNQDPSSSNENVASNDEEPIEVATMQGREKAYFASGCFWCVEEIYESVKGVDEAISGYSGGTTKNPTYEQSNTGNTGHAEANEIIYDPTVVSFETLVDVYFASQNIEQVNGQGPDRGSQYRSIVFYQNDEQKKIINDKIAQLEADGYDVAAEVKPFQKFWVAEDYHQDYAERNPSNGYIQNVSIPRWRRFAKEMPEVIKDGVSH